MLTISDQWIAEHGSPSLALSCVREAHRALALGTADNVLRTRARTPHLSLHSLSAASEELGFAATKVYSATRHGVVAHVLLYSIESGELLALLDANELGRLRTSAASALGASTLCQRPARRLGILGTGFQASGHIRAFFDPSSGFTFESCQVFSRRPESREAFVRTHRALGVPLSAAASAEALVKECDLIVTITTSSRPVVQEDWLDNCAHITAAGSNSLARQELPPRAVTGASVVAVDSRAVAEAESGDLLPARENGKIRLSQVFELGDLIIQPELRGTQRHGYSLFLSHGLAVQDLYVAARLYTLFVS